MSGHLPILLILILTGLLMGCESAEQTPSEARRPVVLSTDCGVEMDDQWALAHLALSPELDLVGVVTAQAPVLVTIDDNGIMGPQGPPPPEVAEATALVARALLDHLPLENPPPVVAGSNTPLPDITTPCPSRGADFIIEASEPYAPDRRLTVLVIGPATDVASALLIDPSLSNRIEVVAMGFMGWPDGTDPFNVKNDIPAWQVLMDSDVPLTVADAAVTARHLRMTPEHTRALFEAQGTAGQYLVNLLTSWLDNHPGHAETYGEAGTWPVWDEGAVAYLLGMTTQTVHTRPRLRDDITFEHPEDAAQTGTITWITSIDADRLWADFTRKLEHARDAADR